MSFTKKQLAGIIVMGSRYNNLLVETEDNLGKLISTSFTTLANISPQSALQVIEQLNEYVEALEAKIENDKQVIDDTITEIEDIFDYREE